MGRSQKTALCRRQSWLTTVAILLSFLVSGVAVAQEEGGGNPFEADIGKEKKQTKIEEFERKKVERKTIEEEEGKGPKLKQEGQVPQWKRDQLQYQEKAIRLMERRIDSADADDPDFPLFLERLSEMYWQKAKYHDLRAFDRLNESREFEDAGNTSKAEEMKRLHEEDLKTAEEYREKTIEVYAQIIGEFPLYENSDKVLFYLAFNLAEMGRLDDAHEFYQQLVRDYPDSVYIPDAYVGLAEYSYAMDEDMDLALEQYQYAIDADPGGPVAGYAMYKQGWAYFNKGEPKKALAQFENVVEYSEKNPDARSQLRSEAVKEIVKAYSLWDEASPRKAKRYLGKFAEDDKHLQELMERLARLYSEDGKVDESIYIYNQLIKDHKNEYKIVEYQVEIMLNVETKNIPDETASEIIRTVKLYRAATDKKLEGWSEEKEKEYYATLEEYTRETAKWYHLTAQTTKNPLYYALAYEIYKAYVDNFPEANDNYEMMYYYAELLYWKKNYPEAARRYDQTLDINEQGKYSKDAAYGAVLSYNRVTENVTEECPAIPVTPEPAEGEEQTYPRFELPECRTKLIEAADRYAKINPEADKLVDIKYTAARVYYDYNQFDEAVPRFDDIANNHSENRLAIISANLVLDSMMIKKDYENMWDKVLAYKKNENLYRPPLAEVLDGLEEQLAFKFCVDKEDKKLWAKAATCYEDFATSYPNSGYSPKALWNASVDWENASEIGKAIETRIRLLKEHGDEEYLAPKALYSIGQNFHGIAVYSEAARFYELFVDKYPNNKTACAPDEDSESDVPCSMLALQNAAAFRGGLGQYEEAVTNYDRYIAMFPKDQEQISKLKFNTGRIYFDQGLYDKAIERYQEYLDDWARKGPESRRVAAYAAIGRSFWRKGQKRPALRYFEEAEEEYNGRRFKRFSEDATEEQLKEAMEAAAEARFFRGEFIFHQAMAIELTDESISERKMEEHLQKQLKKKSDKMKEAQPIYMEVITRFSSPKWGLAAMCRLGMMYHDVANQIQNAPVPKRLDEDQSLIYEDLLLEFAGRFEIEAIKYYVTAVEKAAELGWFSDYTTLAQKRLFDLRPQKYRSASEIKAQPDQALVSWHRADLYDDVEAAAGNKERKKRGPIDLEDSEMDKVKGEGSAEETSGLEEQ